MNATSALLLRQSSQLSEKLSSREADVSSSASTSVVRGARKPPRPLPINGFDKAVFCGNNRIAANFQNCIRLHDTDQHGVRVNDIRFEGIAHCVQTSPDFRYLIVSIDESKNAKIVIYDTMNITTPQLEFVTPILATQIRISLTSETMLLFGEIEADGGSTAAIHIFTLEGKIVAATSITQVTKSSHYETSFCPADETICCLITDTQCYLLRVTTKVITTFSTINFTDLTCHAWADDVTLSFGTKDGLLRLYRETVPLNVINLRELEDSLVGEFNASDACVVQMYSTDQTLLVYVQVGVIFVFPAGSLDDRWNHAKAIVVNSLHPKACCRFLHMNQDNDLILYGDGEAMYMCNIHYAEAVCDNGMQLVAAKNAKAVRQIAYEPRSKRVATFDTEGLVIVASTVTRRTISHGLIESCAGVALLPDGHHIAIATEEHVAVYDVLVHELRKSTVIWDTPVQALTANASCDTLAVASPSLLSVISVEGFTLVFEIELESKQDILALKWSASGNFIGILANKDSVHLVNAKTRTLVWMREFKLRFFVDIAVHDEIVLALGNKFTVATIYNGKEHEPMNVHYEDVSFNSMSTTVTSTLEGYYYGTKMGTLLRVQADNIENVQLIRMGILAGICRAEWIVDENIIITGHDDGSLLFIDLCYLRNLSRDEDMNDHLHEDTVLCRIDEFQDYRFCVKELTAERNLIRESCKRVFDAYKAQKEDEIRHLQTTLEEYIKAMQEKIKTMEARYDASQVAKEEAIAQLKDGFQKNIAEQRTYYENMINDQISVSLDKEEQATAERQTLREEHAEHVRQLQARFADERKQYDKHIVDLKAKIEKLRAEVFQGEAEKKLLRYNMVDKERQMLSKMQHLQEKFQHERNQIADKIKDLKATILVIENEKSAEIGNVRAQKIRLEALTDELAENQTIFDEKNTEIEKLQEKQKTLQKECDTQAKTIERQTQKLTILTTDIGQERTLRRTAEGKLRIFEAMVEAMSTEIYDSKKLEKNALAMLAFFKSPNPLLKQKSRK